MSIHGDFTPAQLYFEKIHRIAEPPLTTGETEEFACILENIHKEVDHLPDCRALFFQKLPPCVYARIVAAHILFVKSCAMRYKRRASYMYTLPEIVESGLTGLMDGLWHWRHTRGSKRFITYLKSWVEKQIRSDLRVFGFRTYGVLSHGEEHLQIKLARALKKYGDALTPEIFASEAGISLGVARRTMRNKVLDFCPPISNLSREPLDGSWHDDRRRCAMDSTSFNPEEALIAKETLGEYETLRARAIAAVPSVIRKLHLHQICMRILIERVFRHDSDTPPTYLYVLGQSVSLSGTRILQLEVEVTARVARHCNVSAEDIRGIDGKIERLQELVN